MAKINVLLLISIIALLGLASAFDPKPLQDFCVADPTSPIRINGLPCKDPATVTSDDFFFKGLHIPGNTSNPLGLAVTPVTVPRVPGLNTLGISMARVDFAENGILYPHLHPRATEINVVLEGAMEVGFVTGYPNYRHYSKVVVKGDVFVVPVGLIHYQRNVFAGKTVLLAASNSQSAGVSTVTNAVFGAKPAINSDYLSKAFLLDKKIVEELQTKF